MVEIIAGYLRERLEPAMAPDIEMKGPNDGCIITQSYAGNL
jgi:hypothetical protein